MELCLVCTAIASVSILLIVVAGLQAIASICKQGGVTIRIIQEQQCGNKPIEQESAMSKEEKDAIDQYNAEQSAFISSIRNLQKMFIGEDQMPGEDKK